MEAYIFLTSGSLFKQNCLFLNFFKHKNSQENMVIYNYV